MKLFWIFLPLLLVFLPSCAAEQYIIPGLVGGQEIGRDHSCNELFPQGNYHFVHSIDFSMENGAGSTVIGITTLSGTSFECALVTVEGFTLFQAVYRGEEGLEVLRAVPPFDNPGFAEGLVDDIRALFLPPASITTRKGTFAGGDSVCRHIDEDGRVVDLLLQKVGEDETDGCWQVNYYGADLTLERTISGYQCKKIGSSLIPEFLKLKSYAHGGLGGKRGYSLKMKLIRVDNLNEI